MGKWFGTRLSAILPFQSKQWTVTFLCTSSVLTPPTLFLTWYSQTYSMRCFCNLCLSHDVALRLSENSKWLYYIHPLQAYVVQHPYSIRNQHSFLGTWTTAYLNKYHNCVDIALIQLQPQAVCKVVSVSRSRRRVAYMYHNILSRHVYSRYSFTAQYPTTVVWDKNISDFATYNMLCCGLHEIMKIKS